MVRVSMPLAPVIVVSDGTGSKNGKRDINWGHARLIDAPVSNINMHSWFEIFSGNTGDLNLVYGRNL